MAKNMRKLYNRMKSVLQNSGSTFFWVLSTKKK